MSSWLDIAPDASLAGWSEFGWPPGSGGPIDSPSGLWTVAPDTGHLCCSGAEGHTALLIRMDPAQYVMHQIETRGDDAGFLIGGHLRGGRQTFLRSLRPRDGRWVDGATHTCRDWEPMIRVHDSKASGEHRPDASSLGPPTPPVIRPPGEWNRYDITARGSQITVRTNGVISCFTDRCDIPRGHLGVEAEYWPIEFRNIRVREPTRQIR